MLLSGRAGFGLNTGLDPEVFIRDGDGKVVPGERVATRSAKDKDAMLVHDCAGVEMRAGPRGCLEFLHGDFYNNSMVRLLNILEVNKKDKWHIDVTPCLEVEREDMELESVREMGCSPSQYIDAGGAIRDVPLKIDPNHCPLRTTGYHVHVGGPQTDSYYSKQSKIRSNTNHWAWGGIQVAKDKNFAAKYRKNTVMLMDCMLGLPGAVFESQLFPEEAAMRRLAVGYGRAGEHRWHPARRHARAEGAEPRLEYRSLSSWPLYHPSWSWWVCSMARCCSRMAMGDILEDKIELPDRSEVVDAINNVDGKKARKLFKEARNAIFGAYPSSVGASWSAAYTSVYRSSVSSNGYHFRENNDVIEAEHIKRVEYCMDEGLMSLMQKSANFNIASTWRRFRTPFFPTVTSRRTATVEFCKFASGWRAEVM